MYRWNLEKGIGELPWLAIALCVGGCSSRSAVGRIRPVANWVKTEMGGEGAQLEVDQGSKTSVQLAALLADGPTGGFFIWVSRLRSRGKSFA